MEHKSLKEHENNSTVVQRDIYYKQMHNYRNR